MPICNVRNIICYCENYTDRTKTLGSVKYFSQNSIFQSDRGHSSSKKTNVCMLGLIFRQFKTGADCQAHNFSPHWFTHQKYIYTKIALFQIDLGLEHAQHQKNSRQKSGNKSGITLFVIAQLPTFTWSPFIPVLTSSLL